MIATKTPDIFSDWRQLGVGFNAPPSGKTPDLERLLLRTAREIDTEGRLVETTVTWLQHHGRSVARHRLRYLLQTELHTDDQAVLGFLLTEAVRVGGPSELNDVLTDCSPATNPRPLFSAFRQSPGLERVAKTTSSAQARHWNLWAPAVTPRIDVLLPITWILKHNPTYLDRAVRKGDLRVSILEVLRWDAPDGEVASETALAKLCGATRVAVRHALDDLEREGHNLRRPQGPPKPTRIVRTPPVVSLAGPTT